MTEVELQLLQNQTVIMQALRVSLVMQGKTLVTVGGSGDTDFQVVTGAINVLTQAHEVTMHMIKEQIEKQGGRQ